MTDPLSERPNAEAVPNSGSAGMILEGRYLHPPRIRTGRFGSEQQRLFRRLRRNYMRFGAMSKARH
jgi:hypothetical protein